MGIWIMGCLKIGTYCSAHVRIMYHHLENRHVDKFSIDLDLDPSSSHLKVPKIA